MGRLEKEQAYKEGYEAGKMDGYIQGRKVGFQDGYDAGLGAGYSEQIDKDVNWLKANYRRYFALKERIDKFISDFVLAAMSE